MPRGLRVRLVSNADVVAHTVPAALEASSPLFPAPQALQVPCWVNHHRKMHACPATAASIRPAQAPLAALHVRRGSSAPTPQVRPCTVYLASTHKLSVSSALYARVYFSSPLMSAGLSVWLVLRR
jgi:hypothetical protein